MLKLVGAVQHLHVVWCGPQSASRLSCSLLTLTATTACCGAGSGDHKCLVRSGFLFGVLRVRVAGWWPREPVWQVSELRGREPEEAVH